MFSRRLNRLLCAALLLAVTAHGDEENLWPFHVRRDDPAAGTESVEVLGPLLFTRSGPAGE